jgi:hypothetical protein
VTSVFGDEVFQMLFNILANNPFTIFRVNVYFPNGRITDVFPILAFIVVRELLCNFYFILFIVFHSCLLPGCLRISTIMLLLHEQVESGI